MGRVLTYLPDHEPALGANVFPSLPRAWTSGGLLAEASDLLIHDSQYAVHEYSGRIGWGHSSLRHMLDFGALVETKHLVPFHYDPAHSDRDLDRLISEAVDDFDPAYQVTPGREGMSFDLRM
jgi:ribonuclease BN (tRNA processing enzyme)